jgi:hypothetical protein
MGRFPEDMLLIDNCGFASVHDEMRSYASVAKRPRAVVIAKNNNANDTEWSSKEWEARGWRLSEVSQEINMAD